MENTIENRETQYTNDLNNIEAQITKDEKNILVKKDNDNNDILYAKLCIGITTTLLMSPFAICDVYFASTDDTCINEDQSSHNLNITLQSYLMASGIIMFISIGAFNFCLFVMDLNLYETNKNKNENSGCITLINWINNLFGTSWLILGCVLFWAYTNIELCSQRVHDYLFARFIIFLSVNACRLIQNSNDK